LNEVSVYVDDYELIGRRLIVGSWNLTQTFQEIKICKFNLKKFGQFDEDAMGL